MDTGFYPKPFLLRLGGRLSAEVNAKAWGKSLDLNISESHISHKTAGNLGEWYNKIMVTSIMITIIIQSLPFILPVFTENVAGKAGIARALSGLLWISPSTSISADFLLLICTSALQRGLEHCVKGWSVGYPGRVNAKASPTMLFSRGLSFYGLQRSQLFQLRITWSTYRVACSSQKLQAFCLLFLYSFLYIAFPSVCTTIRPFTMILESKTCP